MNDLDLPAAAVTAAAAATTAAAAATGALLRLCDVHLDGTTVKLSSVQRSNGLVGRLVIVKGDESETARATGVAIADHDRFADLAVGANALRRPSSFVSQLKLPTNSFFDISLSISLSAAF